MSWKRKYRLRNYTSMVTLVATTDKRRHHVAATVLRGEPHVVRINDYWVDIVPSDGYFLFADHTDGPDYRGRRQYHRRRQYQYQSMHVSRLKPEDRH